MDYPQADEGIAAQLSSAPRILLCTDYDGTLSPLVDRPQDALLPPVLRQQLECLSHSPGCVVAILSGRTLADIRSRVGLEGIVYGGNHGLEMEGAGWTFVQPQAAECRADLASVLERLRPHLENLPGVLMEDKGLTASVHYRLAPCDCHAQIASIVVETVQDYAALVIRSGKMVHEIRPRLQWHKGHAIEWLQQRFNVESSNVIYLGDDVTDEDAFALLSSSITVKVGEGVPTRAKYCLANTDAVADFLNWLVQLRQSG